MRLLNAIPFLSLALSVSAHSIFQEFYVNGVSTGHTVGIRVPNYNGPIENVNSNDLICNGGINPYRTPISSTVITVPAGAQVTTRWRHTLNGGHVIDDSHKGPVLTYLAKVNDATSLSVTGLRWFKIQEEGYNPSTRQWAVDRLIANDGRWTLTIPSCIPPGDYLLRHELIALHSAGSYPGAQFYMECAQIRVTGGGSASPPTVSFPGAYSGSDPGVRISIYSGFTSYVIPGPPVFTCGGQQPTTQPPTTQPPTTQPPTTQPPTTQPPTTQPPTTQPPTTQPPTTQPPTTTPPSTGGAAQWAQCGGNNFSGPTTCQSPYTCVVVNEWYHQCQ